MPLLEGRAAAAWALLVGLFFFAGAWARAEAGAGSAAAREVATPARLPSIEASASLGPEAPPVEGLVTVVRGAPFPATVGGVSTPAQASALAIAAPISPDTVLPGDCVGGPHPGTPCIDPGDCGTGGTCHFFRLEVYRNEGAIGFNSPSNPRTALDDLVLGGALSTPPARLSSFEIAYVLNGTGVPSGSALRVEVRLWDDLDPAAPVGTPVPSGFLGGISFVVPGPLDPGPHIFLGTIPAAVAIAPDDPSIGYQLDFRDDASGALAYATPFFYGGGVQAGSSTDVYWRDANGNGRFDASDARQFGGSPTLANFYAHIGAQGPTSEAEPNGSRETATITAKCLALAAAIDPIGDVDWYRFTLSAPEELLTEVRCGSPSDDSTLALRDDAGSLIELNDDAAASNHCSRILRSLAAGTYYLEIHEKNDDAKILSYQAYVGSAPPQVVNLRMAPNKHAITWDPVAGGAPYDVLYGYLGILHQSGFEASVGGCLGDNLPSTASDDSDVPAPGDGFWYLSRARDACSGGASTYDEGGGQAFPRDLLVPPPPIDCSRP